MMKQRVFPMEWSLLCLVLLVWVLQGCAIPYVRSNVGASVAIQQRTSEPGQRENSPTPGFALDVLAGTIIRMPVGFFRYREQTIRKRDSSEASGVTDMSTKRRVREYAGYLFERRANPNEKKVTVALHGLGLMPEIGYSYDSQLFPGKFTVGMGFLWLGWRSTGTMEQFSKHRFLNSDVGFQFYLPGRWAVGYIPNLVVAGNAQGVFLGMRNSLYAHFFEGSMTLEAQHEFFPASNNGTVHLVRLMVGVNLGLLSARILK
ncbi:MAG: hypothetical protein EP343_01695 [Deltaproteobacteria bacterium]|nr:MAG: hypothetical protein EP343_01695 [Deltaproteobacteria bacterium]